MYTQAQVRWARSRWDRRVHAFPLDAPLDRCRTALCSHTVPPTELDDPPPGRSKCRNCAIEIDAAPALLDSGA